ncbi:phosphotransferase [Actinopolymorpha sp. B17G11]|uniref:phosphotransferase enzyme family protein n=1 Tax=Actinopolymorpha sp. B17G11 TaxID=3160861 RepID=UPI0032E47945
METGVQSFAEGLGLHVGRRLAGGEFGAYLARTVHGQHVVLKILVRHSRLSIEWVVTAVELTTKLRQNGYPAPRFLDVGTMHGRVYTVQEAVDGVMPDQLRPSHLRQLIELWRLHHDVAAQAGVSGTTWATHAVEGLRTGSETVYIDHSVLRGCGDPRVAEVLDAAIAIGQRTDPDVFRTGDVVHADLHHRNVLVRGDQIVAVFDWEGAHAGDSRFDLIRLVGIPCVDAELANDLLGHELDAANAYEVRAAVDALSALQGLTFAVRSKPDSLEHFLGSAQRLLLG